MAASWFANMFFGGAALIVLFRIQRTS